LGSNLVAHKFKQKVLNFCENSHMVSHSNFWYVTCVLAFAPQNYRPMTDWSSWATHALVLAVTMQ
jgi:hypothetical protein